MAKIEWIDERLVNWSRWRLIMRSGGGNYARTSMRERVDGEGWDAPTVIPTNDAEAADTDDAVERLPSELRATVSEYYLSPGSIKTKIKRLCCAESVMYDRIGSAHRMIANHLLAKQDQARVERERVEALQLTFRVLRTGPIC